MNEDTRVVLISLPAGLHWVRYEDASVIGLAAHLDLVGQDLALIDAGRPDVI